MHTLFDFITHIKIVEYLIAIGFIAGYIIYWEALKPAPFRRLKVEAGSDLDYIRNNGGVGSVLKTVGKICTAPFVGLAYIVVLPFAFVAALGSAALKGILGLAGREASFGWRPSEAYLAGKKDEKTRKDENPEKSDDTAQEDK